MFKVLCFAEVVHLLFFACCVLDKVNLLKINTCLSWTVVDLASASAKESKDVMVKHVVMGSERCSW